MQIFRVRGIGDVDDRGPVRLGLAGQRIDRIGNLVGAAVMADIGDPAIALMMDGRLIGAARLQVVIPTSFMLEASGGAPITWLVMRSILLARAEHLGAAARDQSTDQRECKSVVTEESLPFETTGHVFSTQAFKTNLAGSTATLAQHNRRAKTPS
jgi:hypothetical protein